MAISGAIEAMWRHPVKGFTPEPLTHVRLTAREGLPFDRVYAVENGPSGFDPAAPAHVSKMRFAVLAPVPEVAKVATRLDEVAGLLHATAPGRAPIVVDLAQPAGAMALADWLAEVLGDAAKGPLRVVHTSGHRFLDDPRGQISLTNLASLDALSQAVGVSLSPRRLRGNIDVSGWPAFAETKLAPGAPVRLGQARATVIGPIRRCVATHVNPMTATRDVDLVEALMKLTGRADLGVYVRIENDGDARAGDLAEVMD